MTIPPTHPLASERVVIGTIDERLADVAHRLTIAGIHHCVVLDETKRKFMGLIQFADIVGLSNPANRILGDIMCDVRPMPVSPAEPADQVADLFDRYQLTEAVLINGEDQYVGLITAQSILAWRGDGLRRAEAELRIALEQAKEGSRAKDAFVAAISHELRTPLNPVLLLASDYAARHDLPEGIRLDFQTIAKQTAVEVRLIDDLLELTRIGSRHLSLSFEKIDAHAVLMDALEDAAKAFEEKGIAIDSLRQKSPAWINGDISRLQQAFWNVLDNAIKYTEKGGRVRVETGLSVDKRILTIVVADTGVGMLPDELERAFEPFARRGSMGLSKVRADFGLRLGLAVARRIIENHGGTIGAASDGRDTGAIFTIELPLIE